MLGMIIGVGAVIALMSIGKGMQASITAQIGETTKPIERSHIATRDRLRASRGFKRVSTGQRFAEGFEALQALRGGHVALEHLVPGYRPAVASPHATSRAIVSALCVLAARLPRRPKHGPLAAAVA
jgi:hypothetical protein